MTNLSKRVLFWLPRVLSIAFIAFLSMFALDVFRENQGVWHTLVALCMHLIPSFVLIIALVLAWRWEWIGAVLYGVAGVLYVLWVLPRPFPPVAIKLVWCTTIAGPAFIIAILFWINWLKHAELRSQDAR